MILAVLQARFSSSRLPGKVLKPILGRPMLLRQIERAQRAKRLDRLVVATSTDPSDDAIEAICREHDIACFRGSLNDVLERFVGAAAPYAPEHVVRLTGDNPLADPSVIDHVIGVHVDGGYDYTSNCLPPTYPDGLDVEIGRYEALKTAHREATLSSDREHVTCFLYGHPERFKIGAVRREVDLSHLRWTVDHSQDFAAVEKIYMALYPRNPNFTTKDILDFLDTHPEVVNLNKDVPRNEGLTKSLRKDQFTKRYKRSQELLERALKSIPLGSQTFSKSKTQYPEGISPFFLKRGQGSHVWDVDGNEYIDFVNGLCSINLGYNDPDVLHAVQEQLKDGVNFTLPHPIEYQVAEKLIELVPGIEKVRFGKNGSDATAGAVRLARAHTGRDRVAVCGYHGWQDWYIGSTARNRGVPKATRDLTHTFTYNDLDSLHRVFKLHPQQFAAVIMEPMNIEQPKDGFLAQVKELTHREGALLIFDETITGFRFAKGGAQELFGVTADLVTFGKAIANGFPLSAVAGRTEIMRLMEEIFFSVTFGGEALSLAAGLATMKKIQSEPVIETMYSQGRKILSGLQSLLEKHALTDTLSVAGNPTWSFLKFADGPKYSQWQIKTLFLQELFMRGVLFIGTHNLSYSHGDADVKRLLTVYDEVLAIVHEAIKHETLDQLLMVKPLEPLFKVR